MKNKSMSGKSSVYLPHFHLDRLPFSLTPDTHFFCNSPQHVGALNTALVCLDQGEGFIKITGEVGSGKTLLCRLLLNHLSNSEHFLTAYLPNPNIRQEELAVAIAKEIGLILDSQTQNAQQLQETLFKRLIHINQEGKTVVLLIDEAQAMPTETLEALRLLSNLEAETHKLLQIVLFGQHELNDKLNSQALRQLKQRIAFSYEIKPLTRTEMGAYVRHRLAIAGHTQGNLFTPKSLNYIYKYSAGIPRVINILCHKALLASYGLGLPAVNMRAVKLAKRDTDFAGWHHRNASFIRKILRRIFNLFHFKRRRLS
jgi:MSHA biogenesis protein MshM